MISEDHNSSRHECPVTEIVKEEKFVLLEFLSHARGESSGVKHARFPEKHRRAARKTIKPGSPHAAIAFYEIPIETHARLYAAYYSRRKV